MRPAEAHPRRGKALRPGPLRAPRGRPSSIAIAAVLISSFQARAADVISDGDFQNASWSIILGTNGTGGSASSVRAATGGNPDAMRRVQLNVTAAPNASTQSIIWAAHLRAGYAYSPATRGPLASITLAEDSRSMTVTPEPQWTGPVLRQDGVLFVARRADTGNIAGWHRVTSGVFTQNDFAFLDSSDTIDGVDESIRPNFSAAGSPIEVGFYRALASGLGGGTRASDQGVDNLLITITPATPPPCPGDINNDGAVNTLDLTAFLARFGQTVTPGTNGDLNNDGAVNTQDLTAFLSRFGTSC